MEILIKNNQKAKRINQTKIKKLIKQVLFYEECKNKEVSILLTDNQSIKQLNFKYRGIDQATNVLSFSQEDSTLLGDLVISVEFAVKEAEILGYSFEEELQILLVHGLLQLLGYSHKDKTSKQKMEQQVKKYLKKLGMKR